MQRSRLGALDGLRGLAALTIVVIHVWMFVRGDAGSPPKDSLDYVIGEFRLAVPLFFALSGFLLFRPWIGAVLMRRPGPDLGRYAIRRAARVLPAYWAAVIGAYALLSITQHSMLPSGEQLALFATFTQIYDPSTSKLLDPPMWTLAVEVSFYLLLPVLGWAALRFARGRRTLLALTLGAGAVGVAAWQLVAAGVWPVLVESTLAAQIPYFVSGMAAAVLVHGRELSRRSGWALLLGGIVLVVANGAWHALALTGGREQLRDLPVVLGFGMIIAASAAAPLPLAILRRGPLAWAGTLSYGLYLWHFPVIVWLRTQDRWPETLLGAVTTTLAIGLALATVSWFALERPIQRWAARRTAPSRPRVQGRTAAGEPAYASR